VGTFFLIESGHRLFESVSEHFLAPFYTWHTQGMQAWHASRPGVRLELPVNCMLIAILILVLNISKLINVVAGKGRTKWLSTQLVECAGIPRRSALSLCEERGVLLCTSNDG
jgi:hypothetical protein